MTVKAFPARSHHIQNILDMMEYVHTHSGEKEKLVAECIAGEIREFREKMSNAAACGPYELPIIHDYVGKKGEGAEKFAAGLRAFYTDFLSLPEKTPFLLQSNMQDGICASCTVSRHCAEESPYDDVDIQRFLVWAEQAGLPVPQPLGISKNSSAILTNLQVARQVLQWVVDQASKNACTAREYWNRAHPLDGKCPFTGKYVERRS